MMRVFSGKVNPDATVANPSKETDEKLGGLFFLQGKEQIPAGQAKAGDHRRHGQAQGRRRRAIRCAAKGSGIVIPPIKFPEPSISFAIEPKTRADEDRISQASHRIMEEDPTVRFERDPDTSPAPHLRQRRAPCPHRHRTSSRSATTSTSSSSRPRSPTRRRSRAGPTSRAGTRSRPAAAASSATSGSRWSPCRAARTSSSRTRSSAGPSPGTSSRRSRKGILEARKKGVLAGYPVVDFKVILYDGSYHDVDSSDIAFKIAASKAFKLAMKEAKPTILEPVMNVEVYTPEAYMGDIMGNLNGRRGKVQGMEQKGTMRILKAVVPMSEMLDFEPTLTSITGGRGSFLMEFSHYEEAPAHVQQKIIADAVKEGRVKPEEEE